MLFVGVLGDGLLTSLYVLGTLSQFGAFSGFAGFGQDDIVPKVLMWSNAHRKNGGAATIPLIIFTLFVCFNGSQGFGRTNPFQEV